MCGGKERNVVCVFPLGAQVLFSLFTMLWKSRRVETHFTRVVETHQSTEPAGTGKSTRRHTRTRHAHAHINKFML